MQLRYYQSDMVNALFDAELLYVSVLCQSATGSGKTVIMSDFIREWIKRNPDHKVLVSVHRDELVSQTSETLARFGILNERITAKSKPDFSSNVFVGMTQTIHARRMKLSVGLFIVDEAHEQVHVKTFGLFKNAFRVGFTATPSLNKRLTYYECDHCNKRFQTREVCCYNDHAEKWGAPVTMSETYEYIIPGVPIRSLIDEGSLVGEIIFDYDYYSDLKSKGDDDFDENEIAEESIKHDKNVLEEYVEKALGKKTMIFTASTKQNLSLVATFSDAGHSIKSYDSVNNDVSERKGVVQWFKETEGSILVSTGTFTTGFDVKEVECIIINRPTQSLSLWHQIVGRGARLSDLIFKDNFIVIDLGGNVKRLGKWSDQLDWTDIFYNGRIKAKKKKELLIQCEKCAYNWIGSQKDECPDCGHVNTIQGGRRGPVPEGEESDFEVTDKRTQALQVIPLPNGKKIAEFVVRTSNDKKDYYRILIDKYVDLWKLYRVDKATYYQRVGTGYLYTRIQEYLKKNYGFVNMIKNGVPRTYSYLQEKIEKRLKAIFE
jgi:superfamily II DNA or RNA helicase